MKSFVVALFCVAGMMSVGSAEAQYYYTMRQNDDVPPPAPTDEVVEAPAYQAYAESGCNGCNTGCATGCYTGCNTCCNPCTENDPCCPNHCTCRRDPETCGCCGKRWKIGCWLQHKCPWEEIAEEEEEEEEECCQSCCGCGHQHKWELGFGHHCHGCCGGCGCDPCDHGDPWSLFECHNKCGWEFGGWVAAGGTWNLDGYDTNAPLEFNNWEGELLAEQVWFYAAKEADTGGCGHDWGFRIDYVFGSDAPDTQAFGDEGWDFDWDSSSRYGSAIPQLYAEYAVNDLSVIVGHFYTIIGYEVVQATGNFFQSHSYSQFYAEPFTHTGVLASYDAGCDTTIWAGYTFGWDSGFENLNEADTFLGGISIPWGDYVTFTWACVAGDFGAGNNDLADGGIYMNSWVVDVALTDKLSYVFQHDWGHNFDIPGQQSTHWYTINQCLFYEINGCWSVGGRFEWDRDDDGARINLDGVTGSADYYEATVGLNYRPNANVVFRPEVRWDWARGFDGAGPFDNGNADDQATFGVDVVVTY